MIWRGGLVYKDNKGGSQVKKLMASDIDGTFVRGDVEELKKNIEAVRRWREAGNIFIFATGRDWISVDYEKKKNGIEYDQLVALNGGFICDESGKELYKKVINNDVARDIINTLSGPSNGQVLVQNGIDGCYKVHNVEGDEKIINLHKKVTEIYKYSAQEALEREVVSVGCRLEDKEMVQSLCDRVNAEYPEHVNAVANTFYVCVAGHGISKASGIKKVMEHYGITQDNVYTIGDDYNDIPMIEAYHGAAMDNAVQATKDVADEIVTSVHEFIDLNL